MINIISVDNKSIEFTKDEIRLSGFLKTMCLGDEFEKETELQIPKVDFDNLFYIKRLSTAIIENDMNVSKYLKLTDEFTIEKLFSLLHCVNFLDNDIIIQLIKKKIDTILKDNTREDILKIFKLENKDFTEMENAQMDLLNEILLN
tara:strand:- start:1474 stop:1911 length:438 start_codon:yes stop_codon:yes gene_type:complete